MNAQSAPQSAPQPAPTTMPPPVSLEMAPDRGAIAQLAAALLWLPQAALIAGAIQRLADGGGVAAILPAAIAVIAIGLVRAGCDAWGARAVFGRARGLLSTLRAEVAATLARNSPFDRDRPASGLASSAIGEQAEAILPALTGYPPVRLRLRVVPVVILVVVGWYSWLAALVLAFAAPLIPLFMALIGWRARAASEEQLIEQGRMNAFLLDRLRGLRTLRAFGAVEATARRLGASADELRRRTMAVLRIAFLSSAVLELFAALGVALVAVYIGFHLLGQLRFGAWGDRLTLGEGLFILMLAPAFFEPLRDLAAVWHDRASGAAALATLDRLRRPTTPLVMAAPMPIRAPFPVATPVPIGSPVPIAVPFPVASVGAARAAPAAPRALAITVTGLVFGHPGSPRLFDGLDLDIAAGEQVAVLGPSGIGKSSLLALVAGLAEPGQGSIRIGDVAMTGASAPTARARIGWMGQQAPVFAASLRWNVTVGRTVAPAVVERAIALAGLDRVAASRGDAPLGEDGSGLSGGERVRLAIARLAARPDAAVLLVDEPTAHLDRLTAAAVIDVLLVIAAGRTLVVATHDPAVAIRMNRTIRLPAVTVAPRREAA